MAGETPGERADGLPGTQELWVGSCWGVDKPVAARLPSSGASHTMLGGKWGALVACCGWAADNVCLCSVPSLEAVLKETKGWLWQFFFFQLYCLSKNKAVPFLWPESQSCSLDLCGSHCGEAKSQGSAKRSFHLVMFYWWFFWVF